MNGWKELEIDNLPPDILTGGYEFMINDEEIGYIHKSDRVIVFQNLILNNGKYFYLKPELIAPAHKEIMTKWWNINNEWGKVNKISYSDSHNKRIVYHVLGTPLWNTEFKDMQSAYIPPE